MPPHNLRQSLSQVKQPGVHVEGYARNRHGPGGIIGNQESVREGPAAKGGLYAVNRGRPARARRPGIARSTELRAGALRCEPELAGGGATVTASHVKGPTDSPLLEKTVGKAARRPSSQSVKAKSSPFMGMPSIGSGMLPIELMT